MSSRLLMTQRRNPFEDNVEKGENTGNYHFFFSHVFSLSQPNLKLIATIKLSYANTFNLTVSNVCLVVKT